MPDPGTAANATTEPSFASHLYKRLEEVCAKIRSKPKATIDTLGSFVAVGDGFQAILYRPGNLVVKSLSFGTGLFSLATSAASLAEEDLGASRGPCCL